MRSPIHKSADAMLHGMGEYPGFNSFNMIGMSNVIGQSQMMVWNDDANPHIWPSFDGEEITVQSDSIEDSEGGTGAEAIFVRGVNSDGYHDIVTVPLQGTTPVVIPQLWKSVDMLLVAPSNGQSNIGKITATCAAGQVDFITPGVGISQTAACMVPDNAQGKLSNIFINALGFDDTSGLKEKDFLTVWLRYFYRNSPVVKAFKWDIWKTSFPVPFNVPVKVPPGMRVEFYATTVSEKDIHLNLLFSLTLEKIGG